MKINYSILKKAIGFAFIPTLVVVAVAMFATLSVSTVFSYLLSDSWSAILIRCVILVFEVSLVVFMYFNYLEKHKIEQATGEAIESDSEWTDINSNRVAYLGDWNDSYKDKYTYKRITNDLYLVKRTQNS